LAQVIELLITFQTRKRYIKYDEVTIPINTLSPAFILTPLIKEMMDKAVDEQSVACDETMKWLLHNKRPRAELKKSQCTNEEMRFIIAFSASGRTLFIYGSNNRVESGSVAFV